MKLTSQIVKLFEQEQTKYGTRVALYNMIYLWLHGQLKELVGSDKKVKTQVR
jgi:hypothetical protein